MKSNVKSLFMWGSFLALLFISSFAVAQQAIRLPLPYGRSTGGVTILSYTKNSSGDSSILITSDGRRWAVKDNAGSGTPGTPGATGATGATGKSAYEVAVANGYSGSQSAWLASLVGATGATGPTGPKGDPGNGTGIDPTSPTAAGGTPTIQDNTESGTISNLSIARKNMNPQIKFTVNADRTVQGPLCTITFATPNTWTAAPVSYVFYSGQGTVEVKSATANSLVIYGYNIPAGNVVINLLNIQ